VIDTQETKLQTYKSNAAGTEITYMHTPSQL